MLYFWTLQNTTMGPGEKSFLTSLSAYNLLRFLLIILLRSCSIGWYMTTNETPLIFPLLFFSQSENLTLASSLSRILSGETLFSNHNFIYVSGSKNVNQKCLLILITSWDHCQQFSPFQISGQWKECFQLVQNLSSAMKLVQLLNSANLTSITTDLFCC